MSVYMQSTLTCSGSGFPRFMKAITEIKDIVEAEGWRLDRAFVQRTGRLFVVIDIWELKDYNAYEEVLSAFRTHERFDALKKILDDSLISEEIVFLDKAPYSP